MHCFCLYCFSIHKIYQVLTYRHQEMELKRSIDDTKQQMLQNSERVIRPLLPYLKQRILNKGYELDRKPPILPENVKPNMIRDVYSTINAYEILQEIKLVIEDEMRGMIINHREINDVNEIFMNDDLLIDGDNNNDDTDKSKEIQSPKETEGGEIDIDNFCFTATIAHLELKDDDNEEIVIEGRKINVQLYWDTNIEATLVQLILVPKNNYTMQVQQEFSEQMKMKKLEVKLRKAFITKCNHVLDGLPDKKVKVKVNENIKALYAKCFPPKPEENKK